MGTPQLRQRPRFFDEALHSVGVVDQVFLDHLDGNRLIERHVPTGIHDAHAAFGDPGVEAIAPSDVRATDGTGARRYAFAFVAEADRNVRLDLVGATPVGTGGARLG